MLAAQLQEAIAPLFDLPPPVLEWVELVERRSAGQGALSRLLFSLEAFIEKVSPELRRAAERGEEPGMTWWPAVSAASKLAYQGRQLGLTDTRAQMPQYHGRFDPRLFQKMLQQIRAESAHGSLRRTAERALAIA